MKGGSLNQVKKQVNPPSYHVSACLVSFIQGGESEKPSRKKGARRRRCGSKVKKEKEKKEAIKSNSLPIVVSQVN